VSTHVPELFARLIDDAAALPPGSTPLAEAVGAHRGHRSAGYAGLVGPLLVPASAVAELAALRVPEDDWPVGVVGDTGVEGLSDAIGPDQAGAPGGPVPVSQVEVAVAKRGEDPQPGLHRLLELLPGWAGVAGFAEIPLTWGLLAALDTLAEARAGGLDAGAKFRIGGLAAELFPTPIELAAVICACRDRQLPFKLTAGLHHAIRHTDPETGFVHHGFLNVLVGTVVAQDGAEVADVAAVLGGTDPVPLVESARRMLGRERPLWIGFGGGIQGALTDLSQLDLLPRESA
jgi:hypothetical protein